MSQNPPIKTLDELALSKADRDAGYSGRTMDDVIADIEQIVAEARINYGKAET